MEKARSNVPGSQKKAVLSPVPASSPVLTPGLYDLRASSPPPASHSQKEYLADTGRWPGCESGLLSAVLPPLLIISVTLHSGSQSGVTLSPSECLAMTGDIFGCCNCKVSSGIWLLMARDPPKRPTVHRTVPSNKVLLGPKCRYC